MSNEITKSMVAFKQARDAAVHADGDDLEHHLIEFVREIRRNRLCQSVIKALPAFDADAWWKSITASEEAKYGHLSSLPLPDGPDEKLAAFWDLASSMGSGNADLLSVAGFGQLFGAYKSSEAASKAISLVVRPFAEAFTDRLRDSTGMASPNVRELAGLPLAAIPPHDQTRIFLSHRSLDKQIVRPFCDVLAELGYEPWLDEHEMPAGSTLHRAISAGMDKSCAVVFFITSNFEDARWLGREIDHAVSRKIDEGDQFAVITLVFGDAQVPRPLREYVWANVQGEADALLQIVRALPIELGAARWRRNIYRK
jgi:TIR domain